MCMMKPKIFLRQEIWRVMIDGRNFCIGKNPKWWGEDILLLRKWIKEGL